MKKHKLVGLLAVVLGFALLLGSTAIGSNMGFKFVPVIPGAASGRNFNLSLPWNNNYTDAASLFDDIATYGAITQVLQVSPAFTLAGWTGPGSFSTDFPVSKGEAYIVTAAGPSNVNPVIVGSHDPNFTFSFPRGAYDAAAPYHQTYTDAATLFDAIAAVCPGKLNQVTQMSPAFSYASWTGPGSFSSNFALALGEGVIIETNAPCNGFTWAHY